MSYTLTEDQQAIWDAASAFAEAELAPNSARWDEEKHFPVDVLREAAALGFAGIVHAQDLPDRPVEGLALRTRKSGDGLHVTSSSG